MRLSPDWNTANADPHVADSVLIARIRQHDASAFTCLYDRYNTLMYGLAMRILGDRAIAEQVVVEVFSALWIAVDWFPSSENVAQTLVACTWERVARLRKNQSQRDTVQPYSIEEWELLTPSLPSEQSDRSATGDAIRLLSADQRTILELAYYDRLSLAEIAHRLELPLALVKTKLREGLLTLHQSVFRTQNA